MKAHDTAASTPTTRMAGVTALARRAMPLMSPPPPTATTIVSTSGQASRISRPTVPPPAITSAWLYGETKVAPVDVAYSIAIRSASS